MWPCMCIDCVSLSSLWLSPTCTIVSMVARGSWMLKGMPILVALVPVSVSGRSVETTEKSPGRMASVTVAAARCVLP